MTPDDVVCALRGAGCVFAEDEAAILLDTATSPRALASMVAARIGGRPLEHIVGWVRFGGLRIQVDDGVFVPRRRTELLASQTAVAATPGSVVVDMCCGTGAVGAVVSARVPGVQIEACDIDPVATACARRNLPSAQVHTGDLFAALPDRLRGRIDIVAANAPYVPTGAIALMPREAREHEPPATLDGGSDGLDIARRVVVGSQTWLRPGGRLLIETSARQAPALFEEMSRHGFDAVTVTDDDVGATVVVGTVPG